MRPYAIGESFVWSITMKRSETRILTTHTGSLPRPDGLVEMLSSVARGEPVDEAALAGVAREATADVVAGGWGGAGGHRGCGAGAG